MGCRDLSVLGRCLVHLVSRDPGGIHAHRGIRLLRRFECHRFCDDLPVCARDETAFAGGIGKFACGMPPRNSSILRTRNYADRLCRTTSLLCLEDSLSAIRLPRPSHGGSTAGCCSAKRPSSSRCTSLTRPSSVRRRLASLRRKKHVRTDAERARNMTAAILQAQKSL